MLSGVPLSWLNGLSTGEVVIDPSVVLNTPQTCQDAFVYKWEGDPATQDYQYGSSTIIRTLAWTKSGIPKYERSFLQFDLTALPVGARITGAKLRLTNDGGQHAGGNASRYSQSSTYLRRVTSAWNEYSVTWNTQPGATTEHQIAVPAPSSGTDSLVQDVLPLVKDILNSEEGNHGFELILQNEQKYRSVRYASTQHSDAARWPKLTITYTQVNEAYYLKDHLGNIRVTLDGNGNVLTSDDYYPFGLQMPRRSYNIAMTGNQYKFSGKELDQEGGLDWYYFGARYYDPAIGRWLSVDPLAGKYLGYSPYNYALNDPIRMIDPDGRFVVIGTAVYFAVVGIAELAMSVWATVELYNAATNGGIYKERSKQEADKRKLVNQNKKTKENAVNKHRKSMKKMPNKNPGDNDNGPHKLKFIKIDKTSAGTLLLLQLMSMDATHVETSKRRKENIKKQEEQAKREQAQAEKEKRKKKIPQNDKTKIEPVQD